MKRVPLTDVTTVRARDGCVVDTTGLAKMLRSFVDGWNEQYPSTGGQFAGYQQRRPANDGPITWLAQETGVPEETLGNILRDPPRYKTTELWIADLLATALGRPQAFHDGTLKVHGNAHARLQIDASPSNGVISYRARIVFAGFAVGRVVRQRGQGRYRAFVGGEFLAEAGSMSELRTVLHSRVPDVCCGGSSLTGVVEPR